MAKLNRDTLKYLGLEYQRRLLNQLLTDRKFAENILDIVVPSLFEDPVLRVFVSEMVEAYDKDELALSFESLEIRLASKATSDIEQKTNLSHLELLRNMEVDDVYYIQDTAMRFFKQQNLKRALKDIDVLLDKGDLDEYYHAEELIKKALEAGDNKDDAVDVADNIDDVLSEDYRDPIATLIPGLDKVMDGGLSRGELAIILAPMGVGKTTIMTKLASSGHAQGLNVLQIFFEDTTKQVQRKHFACWSGVPLKELGFSEHRGYVKEIVKEKMSTPGQIKLMKMNSTETTIPLIKKRVKSYISKGFKPDLLLLDYIDVVQPSRKYADQNVAEGAIMREFENMLYELDIAGWTAIQGNRSSINAEFVETDQMGGSIKKAQIGHFIMSIGKSMEQKAANLANIAILKSRFGDDGLTFEDCEFDNSRLSISLENNGGGKTFNEHHKDKEVRSASKLNDLLDNYNKKGLDNNTLT
jgi:replicative DNA helicase